MVRANSGSRWVPGAKKVIFSKVVPSRPFWLFLGHIVESHGNKGLFITGKSRRMWSVATISLYLAVLNGFQGRFGPKKADLWQNMRSSGRAPPDLPPSQWGTTVEFLAQNLDLARAPPRL